MKKTTVVERPDFWRLTGPISEVIQNLNNWKDQYGPGTEIDLDIEQEDYEDGHYISVSILREETEEEEAVRLHKEIAKRKRLDDLEHQRYLLLKQKFEGK